ncbi:MAG: OmpA family protein [Reinekea sp.]
MSPVNFNNYYTDYLACQAGLLPVNYRQIEQTTISFSGGGASLDNVARSRLDNVITYLKVDSLITAIYVDGHSDSIGNRYNNRRLSERRAYEVTDYLVNGGIDADMILTRYHGERYPIASNDTAQGRAQNRRVTIQFDRIEGDPDDPLRDLPDFEAR